MTYETYTTIYSEIEGSDEKEEEIQKVTNDQESEIADRFSEGQKDAESFNFNPSITQFETQSPGV